MTPRTRVILPVVDGCLLGTVFCLVENLCLARFFPGEDVADSLPLLVILGALAATVPLAVMLSKYDSPAQQAKHFVAALPPFLLVLGVSLLNHMTIRWYPIPVRELGDGDGVLVLVALGKFLQAALVLRTVTLCAHMAVRALLRRKRDPGDPCE